MAENQKSSREIDVIGILKKILRAKKTLIKFGIVGIVLGVVIALSTPKTYTASVVLAPEMSSGGMGLSENLGDLASSFGIDLDSKSTVDAIYPELYPEIFASTDFVLEIFRVPVRTKDNVEKSYFDHIVQDSKMPFWDYPKVWLGKLLKKKAPNGGAAAARDSFRISKDDNDFCEMIRSCITCQVDKKTSVITVSVTDQDPMVAAILADTLQHRLQEYITNYRTKKARIDYDYYQHLYDESKADYVHAQQVYASSVDANQDVILQSYKSKQEELENELQLRYNVYNQVSAQLQKAKAKIQERTPAFTVIERAMMPHKPSSTPRAYVVLTYLFLSLVVASVWICLFKDKKKEQ